MLSVSAYCGQASYIHSVKKIGQEVFFALYIKQSAINHVTWIFTHYLKFILKLIEKTLRSCFFVGAFNSLDLMDKQFYG